MANGLEVRSMALLHTLFHGHELRRPRLCCSADVVQHAERSEALEQGEGGDAHLVALMVAVL
jgi:hypothetical protein